MLKRIKNIFYLVLFSIFIILTVTFYFSDLNIKKINKSRSVYQIQIEKDFKKLPLLKNDTKDIIDYSDDIEVFEKKRKKYKFWDLIKDI